MAIYLATDTDFTAVGDIIREKRRTSELLSWPTEYISEIDAICGFDNTIDTYDQVNYVAEAYIEEAEATYQTDPNYTKEVISYYDNDAAANEKPIGKTLTLNSAGTIYFVDEDDGNGWSDSVSAGSYVAYNLTPGHTHRWILKDSTGAVVQGGRLLPTGNLRMIYLQYPHNFRDLGGWECDGGTIRYGLLFRGAQLHYNNGVIASAADIQRLKKLGIRYEIDLRTLAQTAGQDGIIGTADDITYSVLGDDVYYLQYPYSDASYTDIINLSGIYGEQTKRLIKLIVSNVIHKQPTYYHCQAGADRTGVISAMIAGVLGVSQVGLDIDYEITSFYPSYSRTRLDTNWRALVTAVNAISGSTLRDKFVQWFLNAGVSIDDINAFRASLIDGTPEVLSEDDYDISYNVTNTLESGISTNNTVTTVSKGSSYQSVISANTTNNVAIKDITVTMGGVDITEDVVTLTPYSPAANTHAISNSLTNVTNSNSATSITDGDSYSATLTADSGYTLDTVTVKMGGVDITATVYSSGTISIPNVTGDIVITATATIAQKTNLLTTALENDGTSIYPSVTHPSLTTVGYAAGYRIGSGGTESAASGKYVTGFIPVKLGDTVTLENIHANTATQDNNYIAFYDSSFTLLTSCSRYVSAWYSQSGNAIKPATVDGDGWLTSFTVTGTSTYNLTNAAYFRVAANLIDSSSAIYVE